MRNYVLAITGFLLMLIQPLKQMGQISTVNLRILVVDGSGSQVSGRLIVKSDDDSVLYSGEPGRSVTLQVRAGRYRIAFESGFFEPANRDIVVERSDYLAVLTTHLSRFALETPTEPEGITVKVIPGDVCNPGEFLWAKLAAVFGNYSADRLIKPAGNAGVVLFEPVEPGTYILTVIEGKRLRAVTTVNTNLSLSRLTSLDLPLESCEDK